MIEYFYYVIYIAGSDNEIYKNKKGKQNDR